MNDLTKHKLLHQFFYLLLPWLLCACVYICFFGGFLGFSFYVLTLVAALYRMLLCKIVSYFKKDFYIIQLYILSFF
ncbi:MAG TPA: hypothetical protein VFC68_03760, partial [Treponemataceae bacterium]|nr:hypothetical protein [Treponemataceae bacterium]